MERAVERFGRRKVRSVLIVGLEPGVKTLAGADALAEREVLVEFGPVWADPGPFRGRHAGRGAGDYSPDELQALRAEWRSSASTASLPSSPYASC